MSDEPRNIRLVVHVSHRERELINDFRHRERIGAEAEAVRQILAAGFEVLDLAEPNVEQPDLPPPVIPTPAQCGRPTLGERILPWLRATGQRTYTAEEVLAGVWNQTPATAPIGREAAVRNCFKAIGWKAQTVRSGGVTKRAFHAPD